MADTEVDSRNRVDPAAAGSVEKADVDAVPAHVRQALQDGPTGGVLAGKRLRDGGKLGARRHLT